MGWSVGSSVGISLGMGVGDAADVKVTARLVLVFFTALLSVTVELVTATTVVSAVMPEAVAVEPTTMLEATALELVVSLSTLEPDVEMTEVVMTSAAGYVGVRVGAAVGASEGEALG